MAAYAHDLRDAAIAIANPVDGDMVRMTNHSWSFSIAALREELDLATLLVVNDFTALAMALPHLRPSQRTRIGGGTELPGRTIGLIGPGTGLGVSGIVPVEGRWAALASEGGHASFAPTDDTEVEILRQLWREHGHASAERLLSGPGIELIYRVLSGEVLSAAEITRRAIDGLDADCIRTVDLFCGVLGSVGKQCGAHAGRDRRHVHRRRHRAAPGRAVRAVAVPRFESKGLAAILPGAHPDFPDHRRISGIPGRLGHLVRTARAPALTISPGDDNKMETITQPGALLQYGGRIQPGHIRGRSSLSPCCSSCGGC
ncbi:glucokinase [Massilia sp. H-1]|nr:glucokinase [Massilia sp. H-1]